jgi:hypothetical protein
MPSHFSNDRAQIWLSDLQHVVLRRPRRIDIYDMTTNQWRVLTGPLIDGLTDIRIQGSKMLFHRDTAALIYELTTGDWLRIEGDLLTNFQFTDSFFICQRINTTIYLPLAMMTKLIASISSYERHSTEFDVGLTGSLPASLVDWRHNGVSLNVSSSRLTLDTLMQSNNGEYMITVTDQCNQRQSQSSRDQPSTDHSKTRLTCVIQILLLKWRSMAKQVLNGVSTESHKSPQFRSS